MVFFSSHPLIIAPLHPPAEVADAALGAPPLQVLGQPLEALLGVAEGQLGSD